MISLVKNSLLAAAIALGITQFSNIPFIAWASVVFSVLLVIELLNSLGKKLPFKELITALMGIQMLIAPFLEYFVLQFEIIGGMHVGPNEYFGYALPCTLLLCFGLAVFYPTNNYETNLFSLLQVKRTQNERHGFFLIIIGYIGYFIFELLEFDRLGFIVYLLSICRFIGFLYLWVSGSRYTVWAFILVMIPFIIQSINDTILINLIVFFVILMTFYYMKHRTSRVTIYLSFVFSALALIIVQSVKSEVRSMSIEDNNEGGQTSLFARAIYNQLGNLDEDALKLVGGKVNYRINQGWILADIMNNLENQKHKIRPKYFWREMGGIALPRIVYPDKPVVGDHKKFKEYVGWRLNRKVAMSVGLMGDGYGNFGRTGGMIYCLAFGLILGLLFKLWNRLGQQYPTLFLWGTLIFFYSMRAGDETYMILNWILKSVFFVLVYYILFERSNSLSTYWPFRKGNALVYG